MTKKIVKTKATVEIAVKKEESVPQWTRVAGATVFSSEELRALLDGAVTEILHPEDDVIDVKAKDKPSPQLPEETK